ncbi:MAG: NAD-dependent epimerase/dehydratase family protein [Rhodospirillaceae bacterium]
MSAYRSPVGADAFHAETRAYFAGRTVAVTGGSGFIGSHVVEQLLALGARPIVPTRQVAAPFLAHLTGEVEVRRADLNGRDDARRAVAGASVVMNLAASVAGIEYNATRPSTVFRANMRTFLNVFEAALESDAERFLVVSSACIYPRDCIVPTPETEGFADWPEPTNAGYGWAKRMEEYAAQAAAEEHGLEAAIARPYNAYGPRDNYNPESSHVLPALILKAVDSTDGTLPVRGDGSPTRSFLYADDFARGLIEVTARYAKADPLNIGASEEVSIADAARMVAEIVGQARGVTIAPTFSPTTLSGQPRRDCDTTKLERALGFTPNVSLRVGLEASVRWFLENRDLALTAHHQ